MKITLATLKKFVRENKDNLYIDVRSSFDGMVDCVTECNDGFMKVTSSDYCQRQEKYTMGIQGLWLVGQSRDHFSSFADGLYEGIRIYNCCGSSILAIKK